MSDLEGGEVEEGDPIESYSNISVAIPIPKGC